MDKLDMQSKNLVDDNIEKIAKLFPNCITEGKNEDGQVVKLVDFDLLKQELSKQIVKGNDERYTLNWAGKKQAILTANSPINATLRPCKEESVDADGETWDKDRNGNEKREKGVKFDSKNLYIEGDNLDVLKLLRETYLGKVKMIYIDPPYNTGNDFVYEDDFATSTEEYLQNSKSYDEQGNRMFQNNESNGRFHSDWLSMMYARLKLARDLLTDDGVIFISIDDNEQANLKKICDDILGANNFIVNIIWQKKFSPQNDATYFSNMHDYILCYAKNKKNNKADFGWNRILLKRDKMPENYSNPDNDPKGPWTSGDYTAEGPTPNCIYEIVSPTGKVHLPPNGKRWVYSKDNFEQLYKDGRFWFGKDGNSFPRIKRYWDDVQQGLVPNSIWFFDDVGHTQEGKQETNKLFNAAVFDYPKPVRLLKRILQLSTQSDDLILDFFSGSSSSAHAVMQLNAEDGGNRKFIMVQIPELCDEKSEAYKAGYKNICEIGKERIRRAGKKIKELNSMDGDIVLHRLLNKDKITEKDREDFKKTKEYEEFCNNLDTGFRVLKLDSSCMKDVYYSPAEMTQDLLAGLEDNIKEDRTAEDLLFQVMLDMGVVLSSEIKTIIINGKKVFNVNNGNLICCFEKDINEAVVTEIAKMEPLYAVFRDSSMSTDSVAVNFDQIFETYSPTTTRKVL